MKKVIDRPCSLTEYYAGQLENDYKIPSGVLRQFVLDSIEREFVLQIKENSHGDEVEVIHRAY
jgi:hypothetical protein